jgi:hypothetical protein
MIFTLSVWIAAEALFVRFVRFVRSALSVRGPAASVSCHKHKNKRAVEKIFPCFFFNSSVSAFSMSISS